MYVNIWELLLYPGPTSNNPTFQIHRTRLPLILFFRFFNPALDINTLSIGDSLYINPFPSKTLSAETEGEGERTLEWYESRISITLKRTWMWRCHGWTEMSPSMVSFQCSSGRHTHSVRLVFMPRDLFSLGEQQPWKERERKKDECLAN